MLSLGYSVFVSIINMGDDPKCWVGWDNLVKWQFFIPLLAGAAVGNILALWIINIFRLSNIHFRS